MSEKKLRVAFDVNNTLTNPLVRELFKLLDKDKCHVIVWSTMGKGYSKRFCDEHGLEADEYLNKQVTEVDIAVDDIPSSIHAAKVVLGVIG